MQKMHVGHSMCHADTILTEEACMTHRMGGPGGGEERLEDKQLTI